MLSIHRGSFARMEGNGPAFVRNVAYIIASTAGTEMTSGLLGSLKSDMSLLLDCFEFRCLCGIPLTRYLPENNFC